jgi:hypothetical protein
VVDRRLLTFLGSKQRAKKGKPKKATSKLSKRCCPCGVPVCAGQKMGKRRNSLRCASFKHDVFLSIFCPAQTAAPNADEKQKQIEEKIL